jgi:hypothetical protein
MRFFGIAILSAFLLVPVFAQEKKEQDKVANQDTLTPARKMEIAANTAFEKGDYVQALAIYRKLEQQHKDDAKKLEPIQEKIRVCMKNIDKSAVPGSTPAQPTARSEEETSLERRKPHVKPKKETDVYELSIKSLGNFEYDAEKGGNIPEDVTKLKGTVVRTRGFMIPLDQADNISQFVLVPDLFACCFGQAPQVQHTVVVSTPKGKAVAYYPDEIVVEGTLNVEEKKEDGIIVSLFEIACKSVKPAAK